MKLTVFDLVESTTDELRPWLTDRECVPFLARVVNGIPHEAWRNQPRQLGGFENAASQLLRIFRPLFDAGESDEGPRLPGAELGFLSIMDYWLFCQARYDWAFMLDLHRACQEFHVDRVEVVTDQWHGGICTRPTRAFADGHGLAWTNVFIPKRTTYLERARRQVRSLARRVHPAGEAAIQFLEDRGRRWRTTVQSLFDKKQIVAGCESRLEPTRSPLQVAMLVYQPKSWRYLLPVREQLLAEGHGAVLISPRADTEEPLRKAGIPFVANRHRCAPGRFVYEVRDYMQSFPLNWRDANTPEAKSNADALAVAIREAAVSFVNFYTDYSTLLPETFRKFRISAVMGTDSGSAAGRSLFRLAEKMGLGSIFLQHGAFTEIPGTAEYFTDSYKLVWGETSRDGLLRSGVARPEKIISFGSAYLEEQFDQVAVEEIPDEDRFDVLVTYGIPGDICSEASFRMAVEEVIQAASDRDELQFVAKLHPGDHSGIIERLAQAAKLPNFSVVSEGDVYRLIRCCNVVVTMYSTTGSEALYMGKPVVSVILDGIDWHTDYLIEGTAHRVNTVGGLAPLLQNILGVGEGRDPLASQQKRFAEMFLHRDNRPARRRIVEFAQQLLENKVDEFVAPEGALPRR